MSSLKTTLSRRIPGRMAAALLVALLVAPLAHAETWDGGGDGVNWEDRFNWNNDVLPFTGGTTTQGNALITNGGEVKLSSAQTIRAVFVGSGAGLSGTLNIFAGSNLSATTDSINSRVGTGNGGIGTINQSAGSTDYNMLEIGLGAGSIGTYNLSGGSMSIARATSNVSLSVGNGGTGTFAISGGSLASRRGVTLGGSSGNGTFRVNGSAATGINIGSVGTGDGFWTQNSGSTLDLRFDAGGTTKIFIDKADTTSGNVTFGAGSLLNVGFQSSSVAGTWVVMQWDGTVTNSGLAFANTVDTNIWSFNIDSGNKTLSVTAIPEPSTFALVVLAAIGLVAARRRRNR